MPLGLSPTQWDALIPMLRKQFCTIVLGGAKFGMVPLLEARGRSHGYEQMLANLMAEIRPETGETILEVGCGTGVINRWLAKKTDGANQRLRF